MKNINPQLVVSVAVGVALFGGVLTLINMIPSSVPLAKEVKKAADAVTP